MGLASVAKAFSGTVDLVFHGVITNITVKNLGAFPQSKVLGQTPDWLAVLLLAVLMLFTMTGAKVSLNANIALSTIQIICLALIAITCFVYGDIKNWSAEMGGFFPFGFAGIIKGDYTH